MTWELGNVLLHRDAVLRERCIQGTGGIINYSALWVGVGAMVDSARFSIGQVDLLEFMLGEVS